MRGGIVLVAVVVVFTIGLTLFGIWTHAALAQHRRLQNDQMRLQAVRLAEAALRRAELRRAAHPDYGGEVWQLSAEAFGTSRTGQVRIRVEEDVENETINYEAVAEFPAGTLRRAQVTKRIELRTSTARDTQ